MIYFYAVVGMLDLVVNEDIFYEVEDKVFKVFWILLFPIIGAIYAMIKLNRLHNYTNSKCGIDNTDNSRTYEFVDSHGGISGGE